MRITDRITQLSSVLLVLMLCFSSAMAAEVSEGDGDKPVLQQVAFFNQLVKKGEASREDACRAVAVLLKLPEAMGSSEPLFAVLKERSIIPERWSFNPDDPATQGFTCYLFIKALGIQGGFVTRLFGLRGRSAYLEAVTRQLTPATGDRTMISGGELITILQRSSRLMRAAGE